MIKFQFLWTALWQIQGNKWQENVYSSKWSGQRYCAGDQINEICDVWKQVCLWILEAMTQFGWKVGNQAILSDIKKQKWLFHA